MAVLGGAAIVLKAQLPMEPSHDSGQSVTGAFEGWFQNKDGTFSILVGYFNRNLKQELDIPVGPNNHIEPEGPDHGQPTHFVPGRHWGVFAIRVPGDFGSKKLTWTLAANGKTTAIPMSLNALWELQPYVDATGNTPPYISLEEGKPGAQGPPQSIASSLTATRGEPLPLTAWVADDAKVPVESTTPPKTPPVTVTWNKFRGPGTVTFAKKKPDVEKTEAKGPPGAAFTGKATTTATFSEAGDYLLEIQANDWSGVGGLGFQCCWSSAQVKVSVKNP